MFVLAVITLVLASTTIALPAVALSADSAYTRPTTPGAIGEYRISMIAEQGDPIDQGGLRSVTLDFSADSDFSGSVGGVMARDVEVRIGQGNGSGTVPAGPVEVSTNPAGNRLEITLLSPYQDVQPGDRIVVSVDNVRNSQIATQGVSGLRGFALGVSATNPQGVTAGPVQTRYTLNASQEPPNATATPAPNATDSPRPERNR